ncbi:hypothetical protein SB766_03335 [Pseudomonas sp. SIMBA_077]
MKNINFKAKPSGTKIENAIARFDWNRPNRPYEFFIGNNVRINYLEDTTQIFATYIENIHWVVLNIPNTYTDGNYQIITSQESHDGKEGIVFAHVMGQEFFSGDHSSSMSIKRGENLKHTFTFSGIHIQGFNTLNGLIEFDHKPP